MRIFEDLMDKGLMTKGNSEVFAIELYSPFYLYHFVERDQKELKEIFMEHVDHFFKEHFIPKVK